MKPVKWCEHIIWSIPYKEWRLVSVNTEHDYSGVQIVYENWVCCPICGAKRPKKEQNGEK